MIEGHHQSDERRNRFKGNAGETSERERERERERDGVERIWALPSAPILSRADLTGTKHLNPFAAATLLESYQMKVRNVKSFSHSLPFLLEQLKGFSSTLCTLFKVDCYRIGNYTVCRRVRASFSPEMLRAGASKGLTNSGVCVNCVPIRIYILYASWSLLRKAARIIVLFLHVTQINTLGVLNLKKDVTVRSGDFWMV